MLFARKAHHRIGLQFDSGEAYSSIASVGSPAEAGLWRWVPGVEQCSAPAGRHHPAVDRSANWFGASLS